MKTCGFGSYGFDKESRSTFKYWFAHWCAFQMVALNLHVWRPKYLLHDIEKPWLRLFLPYAEVQIWHREHSNHHLEYLKKHNVEDIDIMAMIIDCECSLITILVVRKPVGFNHGRNCYIIIIHFFIFFLTFSFKQLFIYVHGWKI